MSVPKHIDVAAATLDAERGNASCRMCAATGLLGDFITVQFGGTLVYAMCKSCALRGEKILISRGEGGIEVRRAASSRIIVSSSEQLGALKKRIK